MPYSKGYKSKIAFMMPKKSPVKKAIEKRKTKNTLVQRIQRVISANVENKYTSSKTYIAPVCVVNEDVPDPNYLDFYTWSPGSNAANAQIFNISQGTAQNQRVGNTIKLKRWIIKGLIQPGVEQIADPTSAITNSEIGYVEVFFGRLLNNQNQIQPTLEDLYQNGATAITPDGLAETILWPLNTDKYKIYWRKKFKMGQAFSSGFPNPPQTTNNDFSLARTFGFDVCKYILKNKHIKYEDDALSPNNDMMDNLTVFAVFYPVVGSLDAPAEADLTPSYYSINVQSYAEYEDA